MERKIQKSFVDRGFGFPVKLLNVPMMKIRGEWTPHIDYNGLAQWVLKALCSKQGRLTGNEIHFIRNQLEMTLQSFAKRFCVTHVAVLKWEKTKNHPTTMGWTTEKDIRLFVLSKLNADERELAKLYSELEEIRSEKASPVYLDAKKLAA